MIVLALAFVPWNSRGQNLYTFATGFVFDNTSCKMTSGSGSPTGGNNCDFYIKTDGAVFTKTGGSWLQFSAGGGMVYPGSGIPLSTGSAWSTSITNNSANWNTAYGWGNHASAGYQTSSGTVAGLSSSGTTYSYGSGVWTLDFTGGNSYVWGTNAYYKNGTTRTLGDGSHPWTDVYTDLSASGGTYMVTYDPSAHVLKYDTKPTSFPGGPLSSGSCGGGNHVNSWTANGDGLPSGFGCGADPNTARIAALEARTSTLEARLAELERFILTREK